MTEREIIISFISSIIGGVIAGLTVWLVQQSYLNRREKLKEQSQKLIKSGNSSKVVTDDIFQDFGSGTSIEHMKSSLGTPNKQRKTDSSVFLEEKKVKTNSYFYIFANAYLKITSKDNETINTLTVFCVDGSLSFEGFCLPCKFDSYKLGEAKVPLGLIQDPPGDFRIETNLNHTYIQNRFDSSFAIEFYTGAPLYKHYTFFGTGIDKRSDYLETKNPKLFVGETIDGICISSSVEEVYFIYENEI